MNLLLVPTLLVFLSQQAAPGMHDLTLHVSDVGDVPMASPFPRTTTRVDPVRWSWRFTRAAVGSGITAARSRGR
jgi:hypothetical protein